MDINFPQIPTLPQQVDLAEGVSDKSLGQKQNVAETSSSSGNTASETLPKSVRTDELLGSGKLLLPSELQKKLPQPLPVERGGPMPPANDRPDLGPGGDGGISFRPGGGASGVGSRSGPDPSAGSGTKVDNPSAPATSTSSPSGAPTLGTPNGPNAPGIGTGKGIGQRDFPFGGGQGKGIGVDPPRDRPMPIDLPSPIDVPPRTDPGSRVQPPTSGSDPSVGQIPVGTGPGTSFDTRPAVDVPVADGRPDRSADDEPLPRQDPVRQGGVTSRIDARVPVGVEDTAAKAELPQRAAPNTKPLDPEAVKQSDTRSLAQTIVASATSKFHVVPVGQSLEQVAQDFGVDVHALLDANPQLLKDPLLFAGQRLKIPNTATEVPLRTGRFGAPVFAQQMAQAAKPALPMQQQPPPQGIKLGEQPEVATEVERLSAEVLEEPVLGQRRAVAGPPRGVSSAQVSDDEVLQRKDKSVAAKSDQVERLVEKSPRNEAATPGLGSSWAADQVQLENKEEEQKRRRALSIPAPFDEWADYIYDAAEKYSLEPALIASIIWCESGGRNIVSKDGHGFGLMQIDDRRHGDWLKTHDGLNPQQNIDYGASLIRKYLDYFNGHLACAIAAYDCGIDAVEEALVLGKPVDYFTREGNYSLTVLSQVEYFRRFF
ncbi:MAG: transglycosylase SLT domain-containing protein [Acidobacteriota bacterium]|nr:transglycosylase SLT domain-containing protein [Blastocatellia bacterium]MDW8411098.1 transglycosylase SLT domain-containing protein [Acidobacteriota bacterium]